MSPGVLVLLTVFQRGGDRRSLNSPTCAGGAHLLPHKGRITGMPLRSIVSALLRRVRLAIDRAHYEAWGVPLTYAGRHRSVQ